jgi:hypothetical protein
VICVTSLADKLFIKPGETLLPVFP